MLTKSRYELIVILLIVFENILTIESRTVSKTNLKFINNFSKFSRLTNANPNLSRTFTVR